MPEVAQAVQNKRVLWIEVCKGVGIAAVVIGHTVLQWQLVQALFLFHMPLFFFLSGYLHRTEPALLLYLRKKAVHLLLPYFSFLLVLSPLEVLYSIRHNESVRQALENCAFGGVRLEGSLSIFWFVTCLFITQQVANLLLTKWSGRVVAVIGMMSLVTAYATAGAFHVWQIPWDANVALAALPMFLAGAGYRRIPQTRVVTAMAVPIALTGAVMVCRGIGLAYDMRDAVYGKALLTPEISLAWVLSVFAVSRWISDWPVIARGLASLGRRSMGIMFLHEAVSLPLLHRHIHSRWMVACWALAGSYLLTALIGQNAWLRLAFLGEVPRKSSGTSEKRAARNSVPSAMSVADANSRAATELAE